ncbi:MAG: zf-HC2 domain-containing protein [Pyrinomonadaceae bacterium]
MLNNGNNGGCDFADLVVSYIYDEATAGERHVFESHLTSCTSCTDEFASISEARFSVFEWRREEFDSLPTPLIAIPCTAEASSLLDTVRGWLTFPVLSAAAAMVLLSLGIGYFSVQLSDSNEIAENAAAITRPSVGETIDPSPALPLEREVDGFSDPGISEKLHVPESGEADRAMTTRPSRQSSAKGVARRVSRQLAASAAKNTRAPVLSSYEDTEDKSLRLSDLFDDDGGRSDK